MHKPVFLDKDFKQADVTDGFMVGEYENCRFVYCRLTEQDLRHAVFIDCEFSGCDLSMANISDTAFRKVHFTASKLLGLRFEYCTKLLFEVSFHQCQLNLASFHNMSLKGASITDCELQETDFTEVDLSQAIITGCNLTGAMFDRTNLTKADLRDSYGFQIDPVENNIKGAHFSREHIHGLLGRFQVKID